MTHWYVLIDGQTVGPVPEETVTQGIAEGTFTGTTQVCPSSGGQWRDAQSIDTFAPMFRASAVSRPPMAGVFETSDLLAALVGHELVGFRLTQILGEGGMAVVFRGENTLDASITRAIKVVRPELSSNPEFVKRFAEEARTLERLQHPNVVRFYGLRRERSLLVMELELLSGTSLASYTKRFTRGLPTDDAVRLLAEAADGVAAAHSMGVVHRDLKPENLFLTDSGPLKVLDFGIARAVDEADRAGRLTQAGMTLGTPAYMAPEVCNGATPSETADVYALGLTLYELLAGHHPILPEGANRLSSAQMMFAQVNKAVPPIQDLRSDVPRALADIVARAIAKDPRERLPDAGALASALRGVQAARQGALSHAGDNGTPATRFDIPQLGSMPRAGSPPDGLGHQTSFALPPVGQRSPGGSNPEYGSRDGHGAPDDGRTGFGLPQIDRTRTTGGAEVLKPPMGGSSTKGTLVVVGCLAVMGAAGFALTRNHGGESTGEKTVASATAASASSSPKAGDVAPDNESNKWIRLTPPFSGAVVLGVPDDTPTATRGIRQARRLVAPAAAFEMQQHEVTWGEIAPWLAKNPDQKVSEPPGLPPDPGARRLLPVTGIAWDGAHQYCKSLGGALPREDEWEYAARGQTLRTFPWGNDPLDLSRTNVLVGKAGRLKPVMSNDQDQTPGSEATAIFDLMGNAREWTEDLYREDKPPKSASDESWVQDGDMSWRTVRGVPLDEKPQKGLEGYTAAYRSEMCGSGACPKGTDQRRQFVGFRCVRHVVGAATPASKP